MTEPATKRVSNCKSVTTKDRIEELRSTESTTKSQQLTEPSQKLSGSATKNSRVSNKESVSQQPRKRLRDRSVWEHAWHVGSVTLHVTFICLIYFARDCLFGFLYRPSLTSGILPAGDRRFKWGRREIIDDGMDMQS